MTPRLLGGCCLVQGGSAKSATLEPHTKVRADDPKWKIIIGGDPYELYSKHPDQDFVFYKDAEEGTVGTDQDADHV